jgi:hypothetical protein
MLRLSGVGDPDHLAGSAFQSCTPDVDTLLVAVGGGGLSRCRPWSRRAKGIGCGNQPGHHFDLHVAVLQLPLVVLLEQYRRSAG